MIAHITEPCVCEANCTRAVLGIEPGTSRNLSENHATRPNDLDVNCSLALQPPEQILACGDGLHPSTFIPSASGPRLGDYGIATRSWRLFAGILGESFVPVLLSASWRRRFTVADKPLLNTSIICSHSSAG